MYSSRQNILLKRGMYKVVLYGNDPLGKEIYRHYFPDCMWVKTEEEAKAVRVSSSCYLLCINTYSRPAVSAVTFNRVLDAHRCDYLQLGCDIHLGFLISSSLSSSSLTSKDATSKQGKAKISPVILVYDPVAPNLTCNCPTTQQEGNNNVSKTWKVVTYILIGIIILLLLFWLITYLFQRGKDKSKTKECVDVNPCSEINPVYTRYEVIKPTSVCKPVVPEREKTIISMPPMLPYPSLINPGRESILSPSVPMYTSSSNYLDYEI